ncbi:hypothetical protein D3C78_1208700 [compost metagenome]
MAAELAVQAVDRQQEARGLGTADPAELLRIARRCAGAHAWARMHQALALRGEQGDGAQVGLLEDLGRQALEQGDIARHQQARAQRRQLLDHQLAALDELAVHLRQMGPGGVAAEHQRQQAGGQQGQQQDAALDPEFVEHAAPPRQGDGGSVASCRGRTRVQFTGGGRGDEASAALCFLL